MPQHSCEEPRLRLCLGESPFVVFLLCMTNQFAMDVWSISCLNFPSSCRSVEIPEVYALHLSVTWDSWILTQVLRFGQQVVLPAEPSQHLFSPLCSKTGSDKCRECSNWSLSTFNDHFLCCSLINFSQAPVVLALADSFELRTLLCDHVSNPIDRESTFFLPSARERKQVEKHALGHSLQRSPVQLQTWPQRRSWAVRVFILNLRKHGEVHVQRK